MTDLAVDARGLTRHFGALAAARDVTLQIPRGSIFGLLGPNGSGKTTLIRMLCGVLEPTAGTGHVLGYDITRDAEALKQRIGYMSQRFSLYNDLTVRENLHFCGRVYGLSQRRLAERTGEIIDLIGLHQRVDQVSGTLSGGWKQRLALGCALIHEPDLIFLDEPTAGIDPIARRDLWDLLFGLAGDGKTLFVSTHYMDEAERCARVGYMYGGRLIAHDTPYGLKRLPEVSPPDTRRLEVRCDAPVAARPALQALAGVHEATLFGESIHVLVDQDVDPASMGGEVREITPSLEDVFVTLSRSSDEPPASAPSLLPAFPWPQARRQRSDAPLRGLWAMFVKELTHIRRDPITLFFMFIVPVVQLVLFGYALDVQVANIPTVVLNLDGRPDSERLVEAFENTGVFQVVRRAGDQDGYVRELTAGRAHVGIRIPPDYTDMLRQQRAVQVGVLIDGSNSQIANRALVAAKLLGMAQSASVTRELAETRQIAASRDAYGEMAAPIEVRPRLLYNPDLLSERFFVPGLVGIILQLVTLFLTMFAITRERELGTLEQLFVTPVGRVGLLLGKILPYGVIGLVEMVLVLNVMVFLFDVPIAGNLALLFTLGLLFLFCGLGLGLFISTVAGNQIQALQMGFLVMLPSVLLSGFIFPRDNMPLPIFALSHVFPVTYFIEILRGLILRGAGFTDLLPWIGGLLLLATIVLSLSVTRFRKSLG